MYKCSLKHKNKEDERCFALEYIKTAQRELLNLQTFVLETIKKKIIKNFKKLDYTNKGTVTRLKYYLILRKALDKSDYAHLHDTYISKIVNVLNKDQYIALEDATNYKVINTISALIQSKNTLRHEGVKIKSIHEAVEFINKNFDLYDGLKERVVTRDSALLVFNRLCNEEIVVVYNNFEKLWSEFGYAELTKLPKESLMNFVLTFIHYGPDVVISNRRVTERENIHLQKDEQVVKNLTERVNILEKTLKQKTLKEKTIKSKELGVDKKPLMSSSSGRYYPLTRICTREYCLLCHGPLH